MLSPVPSLDELVHDPQRVKDLPASAASELAIRLTCLLPLLFSKAMTVPSPHVEPDRLLTVDEAASLLSKSQDWVYRHAKALPFVVRDGRSIRFSSHGIQKYIRQRQGH